MAPDGDPGVAFRELIVPGLSAQDSDRDWASQPACYPAKRRRKTGTGPRSLLEMAVAVLMNHIGKDSEPALASLDAPQLLQRIWEQVKDESLSFYQWRVFSKLLLPEVDEASMALYRYQIHIPQPTSELTIYTTPLISPSCEFITSLTIDIVPSIRTEEYVSLASLPNLGVLDISDPVGRYGDPFYETPKISDRLVRGWSEVPDAFPVLRALSLTGNLGPALSYESLRYVSAFPSLVLYRAVVRGNLRYVTREFTTDLGWDLFPSTSNAHSNALLRFIFSLASGPSPPRELAAAWKTLNKLYSDHQTIKLGRCPDSALANLDTPEKVWQELLAISQPDNSLHKNSPGLSLNARCFWVHSALSRFYPAEYSTPHSSLGRLRTATCKGWKLSPTPFVSLHLGDGVNVEDRIPSSRSNKESVLFIRSSLMDSVTHEKTASEIMAGIKKRETENKPVLSGKGTSERTSLRPRKLQKLTEVFSAFESSENNDKGGK